jgi:phosphomannomutase
MIDIVSNHDGEDMGVFDTQTSKAANILSVQLGALEYQPELGIDLKYFLSEDFRFQNESFKAYLIQVLASNGINVASVVDTVETFLTRFTFNITPEEVSTGLIAR